MIYTSRYPNPKLKSGEYTVVAISLGLPRYSLGYEISGRIPEIAPAPYLIHENDKEVFRKRYLQQLERTGVNKVRAALNRYRANGKDVVLCCFEDIRNPEQFCHRTTFAEWWRSKTGESFEELDDPSKNKWAKEEQPQEQCIQLSLF